MQELAPIKINKNYYASKDGKIYRIIDNYLECIVQIKNNRGYYAVNLDSSHNYTVHWLIANAFLGSSKGKEIHHINQIKTDNRLVNLVIVNKNQHQLIHKHNYNMSGRHPIRKYVTIDEAKKIKYLLAKGKTIPEIAKIMKTKESYIKAIKYRYVYSDVYYD